MKARPPVRRLHVRVRLAARSARRRSRAIRVAVTLLLAHARALGALLRPRAIRTARSAARISILVVVASVVLASAAFAASRLYREFGAPRAAVSAQSWADRAVRYQPGTCAACHESEASTAASSRHATVRCETCHGTPEGRPGSQNVHVAIAMPTSDVCITCHTSVTGRPVRIAMVARADHYPNADCLGCHDPHAATAAAPPEITHPLADLPACTTCHNPEGLKKMPSGHELVEDSVCLTCHRVPEVAQ